MAEVDLTSVPLSSLTAELKRRMDEFKQAQKDLGFGEITVDRMRAPVTRSKRTSSSTKKQAAKQRWEGWDAYKAKHPTAKPVEFFKAKKKAAK